MCGIFESNASEPPQKSQDNTEDFKDSKGKPAP